MRSERVGLRTYTPCVPGALAVDGKYDGDEYNSDDDCSNDDTDEGAGTEPGGSFEDLL